MQQAVGTGPIRRGVCDFRGGFRGKRCVETTVSHRCSLLACTELLKEARNARAAAEYPRVGTTAAVHFQVLPHAEI